MRRSGTRRRPPAPWVLGAVLGAAAGCAPLAWHAPGPVILPWRLVLGVLLFEAVLLRRVRRLPRRRVLATAGLLLAGAALTFGLRWRLVPAAFFHQNGQGPIWAANVLCRGYFAYGPGYAEVLGWIPTRVGAVPEHVLFLAQALAAATVPVTAWILLRALRVRPPLAWAAFVALGASPALARAGQSESYYSLCTVLLFAAAAVLAVGASGRRRLDLGLAVAAAGLLIAEAARVHPVCWVAAAVLPGVLLVGRGRLSRRLGRAVAAGLGIGAVVAVTTGPALLAVLHGSLGRHWTGPAQGLTGHLAMHLRQARDGVVAVAPLAAGLALVGGRRQGVFAGPVRALALVAVVAVMGGVSLIGPVIPPVAAAHLGLWLPVPLALLATGASEAVPGPRTAVVLGIVLVALVLVADGVAAPRMTRLPTDVLEARAVLAWRARMPRHRALLYLSRVPPRVLGLPVYDCPAAPVGAFPFARAADLAGHLDDGPPPWYLRDSLCSTPKGAPVCRAAEATLRQDGYRFEEKASIRLPARPSMVGLGYPSRTVDVTLFALHRASSPAKADPP